MLQVEDAVKFIRNNKRVAIVGLSPESDRPSFQVGSFLQENGFDIIPVTPKPYDEILGEAVVKDLDQLNLGDVDWIDIFLNPKRLMNILPAIKRLSPGLVWCQIGVVDRAFNQELDAAGIPYIADLCPKIELNR